MRFTQEFIDKVLAANNIVDIISQYTHLKSSGRGLMGRCPFPDHKEKTASFSVSPDKQLFHCFGCKKGGNIFRFLELYNGMSFVDSVEYLASRAGIPIPKFDFVNVKQDQERSDKKKLVLDLNKLAANYFSLSLKKLPQSHPVWEYIKQREIAPQTLETFNIGYAGSEWDGLVRIIEQKKISLSLAEEAGLIKSRSGDRNGYFDLFRDRLMFIIKNNLGEVVGFGGRALESSVQPKYLNSPETLLFHKSKTLYGLNETGKYIRAQDQAIVVEGYMDLIALYQAGIKNVVAPLGTAFTLDQAKTIGRITKNIVVLFDGDEAGQRAAERALSILFEAETYPKGLLLPDNLDPDDFIKKYGSDSLVKKIVTSEDLLSLILKRWMEGYRGEISDKMKLLELLKPVFSSIKNQTFRNLCLREVSFKLRVEPRWLSESLSGANTSPRINVSKVPSLSNKQSTSVSSVNFVENQKKTQNPAELAKDNTLINLKGAPKVELFLLAFALREPASSYWEQILHTDLRNCIAHRGVSQVLEKAEELSGQSGKISANLLSLVLNFIESPELLTAVFSEMPENEKERDAKLFSDCVRKVRMNYFDLSIKKIILEIKVQPTDEKLKQLEKLKKDRLQWSQQ